MADRVGTNRQPRGTTPGQTANVCSQSARSPAAAGAVHPVMKLTTTLLITLTIAVLPAYAKKDNSARAISSSSSANLTLPFCPPPTAKSTVQVKGVDAFDPSTGEVRNDGADGIACWFIDSDYNEERCFVRQAYFLGTNDPYKALKTTLKAEIDKTAWETLHNDISRPFQKPECGRIAVKVINHLGHEVMKVFRA
jgi:hypothetical protein